MTVQSLQNLQQRADQIRNEIAGNANTRGRVGGLMRDMVDSLGGVGTGGAPTARIRVLGAGIPGGGANDSHSGLAARNGVTLVDGDKVLDVGHSTSSLRGYWIANSGAWTLADFYDSNDEVAALVGTFTTILEGAPGAGDGWRHVSGDTVAGGKYYEQILGSPTTAIGSNGTVVSLVTDQGTTTTRAHVGTTIDKTKITIANGITTVIATVDPLALGFLAGDMVNLAPNVDVSWATDAKYFWGALCMLGVVGSPPTIIDPGAQQARDGALGANNYLTLAWIVTGNTFQLTATNNRASDAIVRAVYNNFGFFE